MHHIADNHEALLDYLYEEGDPAERLKIATHLQTCARCSVAVLELQNVRGMLGGWAPPQAELGFRIVQDRGAVTGEVPIASISQPRRSWMPAWNRPLQAAAAVFLFAAGMAVSQLQVEYADGSLTVRTGRETARPAGPGENIRLVSGAGRPAAPVAQPPAGAAQPPVDIDALERELRARLAAPAQSVDTEALLQRVRAMIDQSEQRQQRELALRLSQVAGEVDAQHQADLMRIQQSVGQTQEVMDYLVRTAGGAK